MKAVLYSGLSLAFCPLYWPNRSWRIDQGQHHVPSSVIIPRLCEPQAEMHLLQCDRLGLAFSCHHITKVAPSPLVFHLSKSSPHLLCHSTAPGDRSGRQRYTVITTRSQVSRGKEVVKPVHCVAYIYPLFFTVFMWDTRTGAPSSVVLLSGCW